MAVDLELRYAELQDEEMRLREELRIVVDSRKLIAKILNPASSNGHSELEPIVAPVLLPAPGIAPKQPELKFQPEPVRMRNARTLGVLKHNDRILIGKGSRVCLNPAMADLHSDGSKHVRSGNAVIFALRENGNRGMTTSQIASWLLENPDTPELTRRIPRDRFQDRLYAAANKLRIGGILTMGNEGWKIDTRLYEVKHG